MANIDPFSGTSESADQSVRLTEAAERLIALDKWLADRIEEANQAEVRLAKRLENMARAEEGLKALFDALRKQATDAFPLINQLSTFRPAAEKAAAEVLDLGRAQFEQAMEEARARMDLLRQSEREFEQGIADFERRAKVDLKPIEDTLRRVVQETKVEADAILQVLPRRLAEQVESLKASVQEIVTSAQQDVAAKTEEFENKALVFEKWLEEQTTQIIQRVQAQTQSSAEAAERQWQERIGQQMAAHEQRSAALADATQNKLEEFRRAADELTDLIERALRQGQQEAEASATTKSEALRADAENRFSRLHAELKKATQAFQKESECVLDQVRASLRENIEQAGTELRQAVRAEEKQAEQKRAEASARFRQELQAISGELDRRIEELRQAGQVMAEQVEEDMLGRVRSLRPQFHRELENAEKLLGERITRLADELQATIELRESQLAARLEDFKPRANAAWRALEADLAAKAAALEQQASTMTGWLERRLAQRVDELVQRSRRVLQKAISHVDATNEQMNAPWGTGLQVELFVDGRPKRRGSHDSDLPPADSQSEASAA